MNSTSSRGLCGVPGENCGIECCGFTGVAVMRCGRTDGQLYLDHIQNWREYPERRYDPENVQLLCRECHTWRHRQVREWDFRPAL
jgi:hypothetical protein